MGYLDGFGVTLGKMFGVNTDTGRRVTTQYPEEVRPKPERFHGRHVLNRYEDGMEKCIGCELCAGVCPARCIYVRGRDNDPEDPTSPGERFGYVYEINYLRCIHCDLCVEACPTQAITETKMFEFAFTNRSDAIYTKNELLVDDQGQPRRLPWENWDGGFDAAKDTSGWMRATSPGGDEDFVGIVAWAGELGYGVRPPEGADPAEVASSAPQQGAIESEVSSTTNGNRTPGQFDFTGDPSTAPTATASPAAPVEPPQPEPADSGSEPDTPSADATPPADPGSTASRGEEPDRSTQTRGMFDAVPDEAPDSEKKSGRGWWRGRGERS